MSYVIRSLFGPTLNRIYQPTSGLDFRYEGNAAERYGFAVISGIRSMFSLGYYSSPFLAIYLYRRDWYTLAGSVLLMEILMGFGCLYSTAVCLRAVGRGVNPDYRQFIDVLSEASRNFNAENKERLSSYDFDFDRWPVEFRAEPGAARKTMFVRSSEHRVPAVFPIKLLSWLMVHSFGISLIYPGSLRILQAGIADALQQGRAKLILHQRGKRFKLKTADYNSIDAMFFDRRSTSSNSTFGSTLVISSEGNAGFYEVGVASTPIEMGYSVLCWNQPGFGGSTGLPFPSQVVNGADAVMQLAIKKLGFRPEDIIVHGWSIGGFPSTWLAMNYDVKGLILDATFDHLMPLAVPRMPTVMEPLVRAGVGEYVNLNVADQAVKYNGPIRLIRRSSDEMITTDVNLPSTNRGNHLLKRILKHRYPFLFDGESGAANLDAYLGLKEPSQEEFLRKFQVNEEEMSELFRAAVDRDGGIKIFPSSLGEGSTQDQRVKLILFLAKKYLVEYDSSHCTQLPARFFTLPWDSSEDSFVRV